MKNFSFFDTKGKLYVDCAECERGANGGIEDKCCAGFKYKKGGVGGCFIGTLMQNIKLENLEGYEHN